jgi:hypothetical protein
LFFVRTVVNAFIMAKPGQVSVDDVSHLGPDANQFLSAGLRVL